MAEIIIQDMTSKIYKQQKEIKYGNYYNLKFQNM